MSDWDGERDSPTVRALRTLDLLQTHPGITATELADRLGVTDRAARRYVAMLRDAEIPIESTRGPYGGYRLGRGVRLPPLVFSATEALGLVMAVLDGRHAAVDEDDPVGVALTKLLRALPESVARSARSVRSGATAVPDRAAGQADPMIISAVVEAVADQRQASIDYRSGSGRTLSTMIDPWAVVIRRGLWYLLCHSHHADAIRTYRIDRIKAFTITDDHFTPPNDLDPPAMLEAHLGSSWELAVRVRFHAPLSAVAPWVPASMGRLEAMSSTKGDDDEGQGCLLIGSTSNAEMYAGERLAAIPYPFTVDGGAELRAAVSVLAARFKESID